MLYLDTFIKRKKAKIAEKKKAAEDQLKAEAQEAFKIVGQVPLADDEAAFEDIEEVDEEEEAKEPQQSQKRPTFMDYLKAFWTWWSETTFIKAERMIEAIWGPIENLAIFNDTTEVIWSIDACARKAFPIVFLILQIMYWSLYLYVM